MIPLPRATEDQNVRALARLEREDRTGVASATWQLSAQPIQTHCLIFKNGLLLVLTADYTVAGDTVTFLVPLMMVDKTAAFYWARAQ